jgi:hypothetical protein
VVFICQVQRPVLTGTGIINIDSSVANSIGSQVSVSTSTTTAVPVNIAAEDINPNVVMIGLCTSAASIEPQTPAVHQFYSFEANSDVDINEVQFIKAENDTDTGHNTSKPAIYVLGRTINVNTVPAIKIEDDSDHEDYSIMSGTCLFGDDTSEINVTEEQNKPMKFSQFETPPTFAVDTPSIEATPVESSNKPKRVVKKTRITIRD